MGGGGVQQGMNIPGVMRMLEARNAEYVRNQDPPPPPCNYHQISLVRRAFSDTLSYQGVFIPVTVTPGRVTRYDLRQRNTNPTPGLPTQRKRKKKNKQGPYITRIGIAAHSKQADLEPHGWGGGFRSQMGSSDWRRGKTLFYGILFQEGGEIIWRVAVQSNSS